MIRTVFLLSLLVAAPRVVTAQDAAPAIDFRAIAAAILATLEEEPLPPGDACTDCNGTGKVGDGTVMVKCQSCDGTGRRTRKAAPVRSAYSAARAEHLRTGKPLLIMISSQHCAFCQANLEKVIKPLQQNSRLRDSAFCILNETAQPELCRRVRSAARAESRRLTPTYIAFHRRPDGVKQVRHHTGSISTRQLLQLLE